MIKAITGGYINIHPSTFRMSRPKGLPHFILLVVRSHGSFDIGSEHFSVEPPQIIILAPHTPIDFGSILTSSARGSCILLAIDVALLCPTSKFGNSSVASLLAEYTDAPASFTITYETPGTSFNISTIIFSDSLEAVPFPTEMRLIPYFLIRAFTVLSVSATLFCGSVGYTTAECFFRAFDHFDRLLRRWRV
mgnify:CR=1 FL=1